MSSVYQNCFVEKRVCFMEPFSKVVLSDFPVLPLNHFLELVLLNKIQCNESTNVSNTCSEVHKCVRWARHVATENGFDKF